MEQDIQSFCIVYFSSKQPQVGFYVSYMTKTPQMVQAYPPPLSNLFFLGYLGLKTYLELMRFFKIELRMAFIFRNTEIPLVAHTAYQAYRGFFVV